MKFSQNNNNVGWFFSEVVIKWVKVHGNCECGARYTARVRRICMSDTNGSDGLSLLSDSFLLWNFGCSEECCFWYLAQSRKWKWRYVERNLRVHAESTRPLLAYLSIPLRFIVSFIRLIFIFILFFVSVVVDTPTNA